MNPQLEQIRNLIFGTHGHFQLLKFTWYISYKPRITELDTNTRTAESDSAWMETFRRIFPGIGQELMSIHKWPYTIYCSFYKCLWPYCGSSGGAVVNNLPANAGDARDVGSICGSGKSPRVENSNPFQYSSLENSLLENSRHRGGWQATVHGVTKSRTWLSMYAHMVRLLWIFLLPA